MKYILKMLLLTLACALLFCGCADKGMINLNETGAFIWNQLAEADRTEEELVEALLGEYDVSPEIAQRDVKRIVEILRENNIFIS